MLEVPQGWVARDLTSSPCFVVHLASEVFDPRFGVESLTRSFGVCLLECEGVDLARIAVDRMARYVKGGEPDWFPAEMGTIPEALACEWTDGVARVATWFVTSSCGRIYECDYSCNMTLVDGLWRYEDDVRKDGTLFLRRVEFPT